MDGLRLAEHRRCIQRRAPRAGQELGGAKEHGGALLPRCAMPILPGLAGGLDRLLDVRGVSFVNRREHVLPVVRHHGLERVAGPYLLTADHQRDLDLSGAHLLEPNAELLTLARARRVVLDRLVLRRRRTEKAWRG